MFMTDQSRPNEAVLETDTLGIVTGQTIRAAGGLQYQQFLGIRYAEPPVGELRFQPPVPLARRGGAGRVDAREAGSACPQLAGGETVGEEDCLHLNVFRPTGSGKSNLAVMVFIHGGAFMHDSSDPGKAADTDLDTEHTHHSVLSYLHNRYTYIDTRG